MNNIDQIRRIYQQIKNEKDENIVQSKILQVKDILKEIYSEEQLEQSQIKQLQILLGQIFESTVNNGLLNPYDIQQAKNEITESSQKEATNMFLSIGLAALLLSCSNLFSAINNKSVSNKNIKKTELKLTKNSFDYNLASQMIKLYEGSVRCDVQDEDGNQYKNVHILYDDNKGSKKPTQWDGQQDIDEFIKKCSGKATIGYGDTDVSLCRKGFLTQEQAIDALKNRIAKMVTMNKKIVGDDAFSTLTSKQQACLIALWYNIGSARSTPKLVKYLKYAYNNKLDKNRNKKNKKTLLTRKQYLTLAAKEFLDCNKVKDNKTKKLKVNTGLTNRVNSLYQIFVQDIK